MSIAQLAASVLASPPVIVNRSAQLLGNIAIPAIVSSGDTRIDSLVEQKHGRSTPPRPIQQFGRGECSSESPTGQGVEVNYFGGGDDEMGVDRTRERFRQVFESCNDVNHARIASTASAICETSSVARRRNASKKRANDFDEPDIGGGSRRHWCFTIFGEYSSDEKKEWIWPEKGELRYGIAQFEKCPETGRRHLQGYLELSSSHRAAYVKKILGSSAHVEARKGTRDQAREYCRKEETRWPGSVVYETGSWEAGGQGCRTDLKSVILSARSSSWQTMIEENCDVVSRHLKIIKIARGLGSRPRDSPTELHIFCGEPGSGKSWTARNLFPGAYYRPLSTHSSSPQWWDGYDGEEVVVFEDWRPHQIPLEHMLVLADACPLKVPVKGSFEHFISKKLILTTEITNPIDAYGVLLSGWKRRITSIVLFSGVWCPSDLPRLPRVKNVHGDVSKRVIQDNE